MLSLTMRKNGLSLALVLSLSLFLFFFKLGDRSLRNPDEGRYAEIAKEMVMSNDWIEPRLYGVDYLRKPVLFYWLVAASFKLFGFSELAARMVPAFFGVLGVLATFFFAKKIFGPKAALYSALILATNFWYLQVGRYLVIDMVFSFFVVAGLYSFYLGLTEEKHQKTYHFLFYIFVALSFLTKGLAALVIPAVSIFMWAFFTKQFKQMLSWRHLFVGGIVFLLVAVPWFFLISLREPEFFNFFFFHEHVMRFSSSEFEHQSPWYYYFLVTPLLLIPWILFPEPLAARSKSTDDLASKSPRTFLWCSGVGLILFYSLSKSKLPTYILPSIPFFSILMGNAWSSWQSEVDEKSSVRASTWVLRILFFGACVFIISISTFLKTFFHRVHPELVLHMQLLGGVMIAGGFVSLRSIKSRSVERLFFVLVGIMAFVSLVVSSAMERASPTHYTTKHFAQTLKPQLQSGDQVFIYDSPGAFYDFRFYLDYPVRLVGLEGELELSRKTEKPMGMAADNREKKAWLTREQFNDLLKQGEKVYCLIRKSDFADIEEGMRKNFLILKQDARKVLFQSGG